MAKFKFNKRQSVVGLTALIVVSIAGFLVYKTYPHLSGEDVDETKKEEEEKAEKKAKEMTKDSASVKSMVEEVEN
jgi:hypothetical protein